MCQRHCPCLPTAATVRLSHCLWLMIKDRQISGSHWPHPERISEDTSWDCPKSPPRTRSTRTDDRFNFFPPQFAVCDPSMSNDNCQPMSYLPQRWPVSWLIEHRDLVTDDYSLRNPHRRSRVTDDYSPRNPHLTLSKSTFVVLVVRRVGGRAVREDVRDWLTVTVVETVVDSRHTHTVWCFRKKFVEPVTFAKFDEGEFLRCDTVCRPTDRKHWFTIAASASVVSTDIRPTVSVNGVNNILSVSTPAPIEHI